MDWTAGLQRALDYVEEHLTEELDFAEVARQAYSSSFHFQGNSVEPETAFRALIFEFFIPKHLRINLRAAGQFFLRTAACTI